MISYKDKTFCPLYKECVKGKDCHRALTDKIIEDADKWWGSSKGEAPIAMFLDKPECYEKE